MSKTVKTIGFRFVQKLLNGSYAEYTSLKIGSGRCALAKWVPDCAMGVLTDLDFNLPPSFTNY
eukprot:2190442-Amphidinium_carterae.1